MYFIGFDQDQRSSVIDGKDLVKYGQIHSEHHLSSTTTDERVTFSLEKEFLDDDKEEIVYSSTSNGMYVSIVRLLILVYSNLLIFN